MIRFVVFCLGLCLGTAAAAATLEEGVPGQCQLRLSGVIASGDAEALTAGLDVYDFDDGETSDQFLCLSSPGGSFSEAIKLGKILIDKRIGTRIEAGQSCLSACAVVFMMGSQYFYEGIGNRQNANRHMHVTARLGFHRPELKLAQEGVFDTEAVVRSFDLAIQATLEFVRIANEGTRNSTMVPPDLIEAMFEHKGEDYFFIETTGQSARWGIDVDGLDLPRVMTREAAWYACVNIPIWASRYESEMPDYRDGAVRVVTRKGHGTVYEITGPDHGEAPHFCMLRYDGENAGANALYGCGLLGIENQNVGDTPCPGPESADYLGYITSDLRVFLPPATPLAEAQAVAEHIVQRDQRSAQTIALDTFRAGCANNAFLAHVTNVQSFTNLRRAATIGSESIEKVALDSSVEIVEGGPTPDLRGISAECRDLCLRASGRVLTAPDAAALNACFDSNAFWYRVLTKSGQSGYLSGKFLHH